MFYKLACYLKHQRYYKKSIATPLASLYQQTPINNNAHFLNTTFLVLDCEMSGLNPKTAQLLSFGWVFIEQGRIVNASAKHILTHADKGAGESCMIHGLVDSQLAGANSVAAALLSLIKYLKNTVVVFHHASLDIKFLQKASIENFRCPLNFSYVDTMAIEQRRIKLQGKTQGLRLTQCRERYGLDTVSQHNALADAQATAELFLAQVSYFSTLEEIKLSQLMLRCA